MLFRSAEHKAQWEAEALWLQERELEMEQEHARWVQEMNEKEADRQAHEWYKVEQELAA